MIRHVAGYTERTAHSKPGLRVRGANVPIASVIGRGAEEEPPEGAGLRAGDASSDVTGNIAVPKRSEGSCLSSEQMKRPADGDKRTGGGTFRVLISRRITCGAQFTSYTVAASE